MTSAQRSYKRRPLPLAVTVAMLGLVGWLYADTLTLLFRVWVSSSEYSHGLVVAAIVLGMLLWNFKHTLSVMDSPWTGGYFLLFIGIVLLISGRIAVEYYTQRISLGFVVAGLIGVLGGRKVLAKQAMPCFLWLFAVPLPVLVVNAITLPLKFVITSTSAVSLRLLGIAVFQDGNILELPGITLEVVNACSGIRSIFALSVLGLILGNDLASWGRRLLLILASVPIAMVVNILRITITGSLGASQHIDLAMGFYHHFSGWLLFIVALFLLWLTKKWLGGPIK